MGPPSDLFAELSRWRDKATKRGKVCTFTSDIIPDWLNAEVMAAQEAVGPEGAFSFLKQTPLDVRMAAERLLVFLDSDEVGGKPLPEKIMNAIRGENLAKEANNNADVIAIIEKLESIRVKDGSIIMPKQY